MSQPAAATRPEFSKPNQFRRYGFAKNAAGKIEGYDEIREWTGTGSKHIADVWTGEIFKSAKAADAVLAARTEVEIARTYATRSITGALAVA